MKFEIRITKKTKNAKKNENNIIDTPLWMLDPEPPDLT